MARTIATIQNSIIASIQADAVLSGQLTSPSVVAIWRLWTYVIAVAIWTLETLFDLHKSEVTTYIDNMKPGSLLWYQNMALAFRYGYNLLAGTDTYDDTGLTAAQIAASKIIKYAAVTEQARGLRVKLAGETNGVRAKITAPQLAAATAYLEKIKYAGIKLLITTGDPDQLSLKMLIKYNPLVLDANGQRIDGTNNTPVQDAINSFLDNFDFNGKMELSDFVDYIQAVDGVTAPYVLDVAAQYGALPFTGFTDQSYVADAGFMTILPSNLQLTFEADI